MSRAALIAMLGCLGGLPGLRRRSAGRPMVDAVQGLRCDRYSGLAGITRQNAGSLHPVWTFSTGVLGGHEGQPLVVGDTMYVVTPWPNVLYAFDLTREGYPLRWKYRPDVSANAIGISCCDVVNRGAFYADGKIIYNLLDGHTVAVEANSGRELWKTQIADLGNGETRPWHPGGQGSRHRRASGGEFGIYGWVKGWT